MVGKVIQIKSGIAINVDVSAKIRENIMLTKNNYIRNPSTCTFENFKHSKSIICDSVIMCDEIIGRHY